MNEDSQAMEEVSLEERLSMAQEENERLKCRCVCSEIGVPADMTEDIINLGRLYAQRDGVEFEEAARQVYGRLGSKNITTGVMSERGRDENAALRKAFGLK